ncbi:MAG: response regulator [Acidimicrobiia bacterium]|nr:response regulator [Acidimicrobiia bacterium]
MTDTCDTSAVLVVDDEIPDNSTLSEQLRQEGADVTSVTAFEEFIAAVEKDVFDAAFLDWELQRITRGPEMLSLLKMRHPPTARIVVSKHTEQRDDARRFGADVFISKSLPESQKKELQIEGMKLGSLSNTRALLLEMGAPNIPGITRRIPVSEQEEVAVKAAANEWCDSVLLNGGESSAILTLLYSRCWRPQFDHLGYMRASWGRKLQVLIQVATLTAHDVALIADSTPRLITDTIDSASFSGPAPDFIDTLDGLLSILAFVLEVSEYDPRCMALNLRNASFADRSVLPPPWSGLGLSVYLRERGSLGVRDALEWIRRK